MHSPVCLAVMLAALSTACSVSFDGVDDCLYGSPKVHVGPELAEGAPGGPVTGAFPGFLKRWVCL